MQNKYNANAQTEDFEFAALDQAKNYRSALIADLAPYLSGRVVEVGAGIGQMTELLSKLPQVSYLQCVEPDARFADKLERAHPGQPLIKGTAADVPGTDWDGVVNINVLEHIEDDEKELAEYHKLLKDKNGRLCLFLPARPELYAPLDKVFGHFRRYDKRGLRAKLEKAGFKIERMRYYNCVGYLAWGLNFKLMKSLEFKPGAVRFFDRFIFPPVHFFESRIMPPPIGQSLLVIARA
jgi:SAM-dependent methyltransferase